MSPDIYSQEIITPYIDFTDFLLKVFDLLRGGSGNIAEHREEILRAWLDFYEAYVTAAILVSLSLIIGIAYCLFRVHQIRKQEEKEIHEIAASNNASAEQMDVAPGTRKWKQVIEHSSSADESQWRLAILEADIILDEIVYEHFGDLGETLGERLKKVDRSDFRTIDKAWEAHRIRNAIAHEGSAFTLTERDLRQTLNLYRDVFEEFHYI